MTLRLDEVLDASVRVKGKGGPQITVEMSYLETASTNRRLARNRWSGVAVLRHDVEKWMEQLTFMVKVMANSVSLEFKPPVKVVIAGEFPTHLHVDLHNLTKCIADSVEDAIGVDDKHYKVVCEVPRVVAGCQPKIIVTVAQL